MNFGRFLQIPLFDAERCWSYAMQLKQDMQQAQTQDKQTASSQSDSQRKKFHMINKLRKAVQHANALELLCRKLKPVRLVLGRIMPEFAAGRCGDQTGSASVLRVDAWQSPFRRSRLEEGDGGVYKITVGCFFILASNLDMILQNYLFPIGERRETRKTE